MTGRLSPQLIEQLAHVVIMNQLNDRRVLLAGIPEDFVSSMPVTQDGKPRSQLLSDLHFLNQARVHMDRPDPLESWLINTINSATGLEDQEVLDYALTGLWDPGQRQLGVFRRLFEPGGGTWHPPANHPGYLEPVLLSDTGVPVQFLEEGRRAAESVALVSVTRFDGREINGRWMQAQGTGWLIGPRMLITAFHVVNAREDGTQSAEDADLAEQVRHARVSFGYDQEGQSEAVINVTGVVEQSREHDYVILQLGTDPGVAPLRLASGALIIDSNVHPALNIIRHSLGRPKMLAIRNNLATTVTQRPSELGYFTTAAPGNGSSGAPIFDDDWGVVAIHRATGHADEIVFQGSSTAWVNLGTKITAIRDDLQARSPGVWQRICDGQRSRPPSVSQPTAPADALRFHESADTLHERIDSIARGYEADDTFWVWDKDQLRDEIGEIQQQLDAVGGWLPEATITSPGLHCALNEHHEATRRFTEILDELQLGTPPAQRSLLCREFKRRGASLLQLLTRIQGELFGNGRPRSGPG